MLGSRARIHKILGRVANREDPDQTAFFSLIWVYAICLFSYNIISSDMSVSVCYRRQSHLIIMSLWRLKKGKREI